MFGPPEAVRKVVAHVSGASGVPQETVAAMLQFPSGLIGQISSSMSTAFHRHAIIVGEKGVVETSYSNHEPAGQRLSLRIKRGIPGTVPFETEEVEGGDGKFYATLDPSASACDECLAVAAEIEAEIP